MANRPLDVWITEAMAGGEECDGVISRITLFHVQDGQPSKELQSIHFGPGGKSYTPQVAAKTLHGIADDYGGALKGVQTFQVAAFYAGRSEPQKFMNFLRHGSIENQGMGTEAPDEKGMRSQGMRWLDAMMSLTFARQRVQDETQMAMIAAQANMLRDAHQTIVSLREESNDAFMIVKDILGERALNEHEHRMKEQEYQRGTEMRKAAIKIAPGMINQLTGREIFPQSVQDSTLIEALAESIDPSRLSEVIGVLGLGDKPELTAMIMGRFTQAIEKKQREAAAKQLAAKTPEDGE